MRSFYGDCSYSFSIKLLILFLSSVLCADEYLISYRYLVHDTIVTQQEFLISHAMTSCSGIPEKSIIFTSHKNESIKQTILRHHEEFIEYLEKLGIYIRSQSQTTQMQYNSFIEITFKTHCFQIENKNNSIHITYLK